MAAIQVELERIVRTVGVARLFHVPPERVFDSFVDPAIVRKWMLGPSRNDQILQLGIDARVGGAFSFLLRRRDGKEIDHFGQYLELDRPKRLVFTLDAALHGEKKAHHPSIVHVDFAPAGRRGTELVLTHEGVRGELAKKTEQGWSTILEEIAAVADSLDGCSVS